MLTQSQAADIFERIRKHSTADEVEVLISGTDNALTRFANNVIHQNIAEENVLISVRTAFGGRTARAATNKLDDESLRRVVEASERLAKVQQADPDLLPVPSAAEAANSAPAAVSRYFENTAAVTPQQRAETVKEIVSVAGRNKLTAAGIYATSEAIEGVFNSRGLAAWHTQTSSEISITMLAPDSSGWQKSNSPNVDNLDGEGLAQIAAEKALTSAKPREIPAGKCTVILEPAAVLDMVGFMFYDFGGLAVLDQRSFLNNRVGTKLFGDEINIWDDAGHGLQSGAPFDGEGVQRHRVQLVENGIVKRLVYARSSAEKMKNSEHKDKVGLVEPTGHGFPLPNEMGEAPMNLVFGSPANPQTIEQMIASTSCTRCR